MPSACSGHSRPIDNVSRENSMQRTRSQARVAFRAGGLGLRFHNFQWWEDSKKIGGETSCAALMVKS
jgi:hypothetical protein